MTWNYRVVKDTSGFIPVYSIREVYYDTDGLPDGVTAEDSGPRGETREEFLDSHRWVQSAMVKPVIVFDGHNFTGEENPILLEASWTEKGI